MSQQLLFKTAQGNPVTSDDLRAALDGVQAHDCRVLYMHSGLSFGLPNPELGRAQLLDAIYQTVRGLGVPTLCVPTFTFSFCNGEDYDSKRSRSRMGALNEYIRQRPEAVRSVDPLMSVAVVGEDRDLAENLGHASIGINSTFDKLSRRQGVKFLFLGVRLGDCFTYIIVSAIGSAETHSEVLASPDRISKKVLARKLDSQTAFEIVSIDIADIDVGDNIGARLQADQAEADLRVFRANAENKRAMAVANEQENIAMIEENRAKVVEAESEIPKAIAQAFRDRKLGIMDYYKLQNVQADTEMRTSIAKTTATPLRSGAPS